MKMDLRIQKNLRMEISSFDSIPAHTLPIDTIICILMKLPVKTLLRLRCVCKDWDSIFRSRSFILDYSVSAPQRYLSFRFPIVRKNFPEQKAYAVLYDGSFFSELYVPSTFSSLSVKSIVVASCHGLLCLTDGFRLGREICLWNPSIRKHKVLPESSVLSGESYQKSDVLYTAIGMGYDSKTNDYKVIQLWLFGPCARLKHQAEVYSSNSDSWRRVELPDEWMKNLKEIHSNCAYVNGAIYFAVVTCNQNKNCSSSILRFDISEERFREVKIPIAGHKGLRSLTVFKGSLAIIHRVEDNKLSKVVHVWIINESIWTEQSVEFAALRRHCEHITDKHLVVDKIISLQKLHKDPHTLGIRRMRYPYLLNFTHTYTESLAWPF